jgi:hypothetical protein
MSIAPSQLASSHRSPWLSSWSSALGTRTGAAARLGHADGGALFMRVYAHAGTGEAHAALRALDAFRVAAIKWDRRDARI